MSMETTPLHKHPETRELIVNSDINTGNYNIITNDIMANNITVNNLTSNSITNTGDILTDTLHASGGITGTLYGEQVHVVECIKSTSIYFTHTNYTTGAQANRQSIVLLPFNPSTYYHGSMHIRTYGKWGNTSTCSNKLIGIKLNGSTYNVTVTDEGEADFNIVDNTIAVLLSSNLESTNSAGIFVNVGWTNNYLPLPPQ